MTVETIGLLTILTKGLNKPITRNLSHNEFRCQCNFKSCTTTTIYTPTARSFQLLRDHLGIALKVNSGFRCQRHNDAVGGSSSSYHKLGAAIDIAVPDSMTIDELENEARKFFDVVLKYEQANFIHCHNLMDLQRV
jgi:hypothetical protein